MRDVRRIFHSLKAHKILLPDGTIPDLVHSVLREEGAADLTAKAVQFARARQAQKDLSQKKKNEGTKKKKPQNKQKPNEKTRKKKKKKTVMSRIFK